ncbi:MAG TPA: transposase, partial [Gemmatimonadales bacterium]|nr:transposase [Gemmatimonadales bacterium]
AMTIVETRAVTGGVDTHLEVHVAAALDSIGGLLGVESFPTTAGGYTELLSWLASFGPVERVGIEGTGSYGAGLARHLHAAGIVVVEVNRSDRQARRQQGKSDPLDAVSAARAAQSGKASGASKGRDGLVEAIRTLMVTRRSARRHRTATINQMRALVSTAPDDLRARFAHHTTISLVKETAAMRPRSGDTVGFATRIALRELGRRADYLADEIDRVDALLAPLLIARAPSLLALPGVGPDTAAILLIAAGDHPDRLRSEAAWGPPLRQRPNPGIVRQDHPPPAQPRW